MCQVEADVLSITDDEDVGGLETDAPSELVLVGLAYLRDAVRVVRMSRMLGKTGSATMIKHVALGSDEPDTMAIADTMGTCFPDEQLRRATDAEVEDVRAILACTTWDPRLSEMATNRQAQQ